MVRFAPPLRLLTEPPRPTSEDRASAAAGVCGECNTMKEKKKKKKSKRAPKYCCWCDVRTDRQQCANARCMKYVCDAHLSQRWLRGGPSAFRYCPFCMEGPVEGS